MRKEYGTKIAVDSLDLKVEQGEVFGFLGPNGAGKTTTIKMLLGLVAPTAGEACLLGRSIRDPRCRERVGFLPEHFRFHEWLRADEFLELHARLNRVASSARKKRVDDLLELVDLTEARGRHLGAFSKGMLQRIGLAQALIHDPDVVFLDEPTSGLDPLGRRMVRDIIRQLREQGKTVFLNSHLLSEVEITCTRVAFVAAGNVRLVTDLSRRSSDLLVVDLQVNRATPELMKGLGVWAAEIHVQPPTEVGQDSAGVTTMSFQVNDERSLPEIARLVITQGIDLYRLAPRAVSLEDLFVDIVGGETPCKTS